MVMRFEKQDSSCWVATDEVGQKAGEVFYSPLRKQHVFLPVGGSIAHKADELDGIATIMKYFDSMRRTA